ncbi:replication protein P [Leminorella grimontii]|uniref:replication protein P n=1 Tax=Leminorella grimontii TaxID=82981 RepID=UPI0020882638|nr:replication protein P [Leminorella grimontii]GKX58367.1 DNA replication protein [Leminorella grimontii]
MKTITNAIANRDLNALAQMMAPEPRKVVNEQAEKLVDSLFNNLLQLFPAARHTVLSTPTAEAAAKRQWIMAFAENGITTREQLAAGMRRARAETSDFWPSPGRFIGWCKDGMADAVGLPSLAEIMREFDLYARTRDQYESPEAFPWSHPVMYWIVLDARRAMRQYNQTHAETEKTAARLLAEWAKRLAAGEPVPAPVVQIADKTRHQSIAEKLDETGEYRAKGAEFLARMRGRAAE